MSNRLRGSGLWTVVENNKPVAPNAIPEDWDRKDSRALTDITTTCEDDIQDVIADCTSAKEAWDLLNITYQPRTPANTNRLWREFESYKKLESVTVMKYVAKIKNMVRELRDVGETVSDSRKLEKLIMGLGPEYELCKANLNMRSNLTETDCVAAMVAEESRLSTYGPFIAPPVPKEKTKSQDTSRRSTSPTRSDSNKRRHRSRTRSPSRNPRDNQRQDRANPDNNNNNIQMKDKHKGLRISIP